MTVKQQQCLLAYMGHDPGVIDGVDGPKTQAARRKFKDDYGIAIDELGPAIAQTITNYATTNAPEKANDKIPDKNVGNTGTFWDTIWHFTREEFKCKCGGRYCSGYPAEMQEKVVRIADDAREHFGRPAHVISGLRCPEWNKHEGGVWNSQHQYGEAIDLYIEGVSADELRRFVSSRPNHRYSYNINSTNVHFDIPKQ